jgi:hypothetical protein
VLNAARRRTLDAGGTVDDVSSSVPARLETDLSVTERRVLEEAHAELLAAVAAYESFLAKELQPGAGAPAVNVDEMRVAQERVEAAEIRHWDLRQRLLGWVRPAWAPPATLVSDWILEEDPGYDDEPESGWQ